MKKIVICIVVLALIVGAAAVGYTAYVRLGIGNQDFVTPEDRRTEDFGAEEPNDETSAKTEEAGSGSQEPLTEGSASGDEEDSYIDQVVALVNEERAKVGAAPLKKSDPLSAAAKARAEETISSFSHTRPDGREFHTMLDERGIDYRGCGENIAMGYETPETVVEAWMNSEGHRANILSEDFSSIGIGYMKDSQGQIYWVQLFMLER